MVSTELSPQAVAGLTLSSSYASTQKSQSDIFVQDVTLAQLNEAVNDVEMQDPLPERGTSYLVFDTNALIDHLETIRDFSKDIERLGIETKIIIPSVVLSELDGLKNRNDLAWFARTASTVLLEKVRERKSVRVQTRAETVHTPHDGHEGGRNNDIYIYDCCRYFGQKGTVALVTGDKILSLTCEGDENPIFTVAPPQHAWSSRDLAYALWRDQAYPRSLFTGRSNEAKYRPSKTRNRLAKTEAPKEDDDDRMDVDDEGAAAGHDVFEDYQPSHALDDLHRQIISHFSIVLREVADRVRRAHGDIGPPAQSRYAPEYRKKAFQLWTVGDCLDYLESRKGLQDSDPPLRLFMLRRNEQRGWRRGQDWPRQAWENVLKALEDIGEKFQDSLVLQSLAALKPHVTEIFNTRMRPTGI